MRELLYIPFYVLYVIEWGARCFIHGGVRAGYRNVSFEREAYGNDRDSEYLRHKRRPYSFIKYMRNR